MCYIVYFSIPCSLPICLWCSLSLSSFLNRTIRTTVEQHLFEVNPLGDLSSDDCELTPYPTSPVARPTARQRRRHQREQEEGLRHRERSRYGVIACSCTALCYNAFV